VSKAQGASRTSVSLVLYEEFAFLRFSVLYGSIYSQFDYHFATFLAYLFFPFAFFILEILLLVYVVDSSRNSVLTFRLART
jgi:hypothetical protein